MAPYRITSGPTIEDLVRSLTQFTRVGTSTMAHVITLTIPVGQEGAGGWIWDGGCDQVSVRVTLLERMDEGTDCLSEDWRLQGTIDSLYKGLDGTPVECRYSTSSRTGTLSVVR